MVAHASKLFTLWPMRIPVRKRSHRNSWKFRSSTGWKVCFILSCPLGLFRSRSISSDALVNNLQHISDFWCHHRLSRQIELAEVTKPCFWLSQQQRHRKVMLISEQKDSNTVQRLRGYATANRQVYGCAYDRPRTYLYKAEYFQSSHIPTWSIHHDEDNFRSTASSNPGTRPLWCEEDWSRWRRVSFLLRITKPQLTKKSPDIQHGTFESTVISDPLKESNGHTNTFPLKRASEKT